MRDKQHIISESEIEKTETESHPRSLSLILSFINQTCNFKLIGLSLRERVLILNVVQLRDATNISCQSKVEQRRNILYSVMR